MRHTLFTLLLLSCFSFVAFGKGGSSLSGIITGHSGEPIANVTLSLSPGSRTITTTADGRFRFANLDSGVYSLLATASGCESQRIISIQTSAIAEELLLDLQLRKVGAWGSSTASRRYVRQIIADVALPEAEKYDSEDEVAASGIKGTVKDKRGNPIVSVVVVATQGGVRKGRDLTDFDGNYTIRSLTAGRYDVKFSYFGNDETQTGVTVEPGNVVTVSATFGATKKDLRVTGLTSHRIRAYSAPIIDPENPGGRAVKTAESIERAPTRSIADVAAYRTEVYSGGSSATLSVGSGRAAAPKPTVSASATTVTPREMRKMPSAAGDVDVFASSGVVAMAAPETKAGSLTSGEINDFSKWTLWEDVSMETLKGYRTAWPFRPEARYTVLVKSKTGMPLCNARVKMSDGSGQEWEAVTDNTGKAELWYGMWNNAASAAPVLSASVVYGKERFSIPALKPFAEGANILATNLSCLNPAKLDIAFLVDATGSMGDEINYLKAELRDILKKVHDSMPATQVQTGALFYRDLEDSYLTRISDLTPDFDKTEAFIADNGADGGGDTPEGVDAALEEALTGFHWRDDATARLAFLVLDAPPHGDAATVKRMQTLTAQYAARGIRLIPVVCSGSDKPTEYLMRAMALATNGTYLFLTDHSGIGGKHTAPTTDKYDVEYLNGLIYRVIYQCAYMPSCTENVKQTADTAKVQQQTDSATTISWRYYPNPTTGILRVEHTHTSGFLLVTDITGKAILRIPADDSGVTTIDLTQYPAGIYAIRYNWADDKWVSGKFVLMH